jgi:NAD-dependent DNA ligase
MEKVNKVTLAQIILSLGFDGIGSTASKQLAKYIRGKEYSFAGLEKAALEGFNDGEKKRIKVEELVKVFQDRGVEIEEEVVVKDGIGYELTGKPFQTDHIKVKTDFEKVVMKHGYIYTGMKGAKYLITDSMNSSSSKMKIAKKQGVEIITYEDLLRKLGEI